MTDRAPQPVTAQPSRRPAPARPEDAAAPSRRRPRALPTALATLACFLLLFEFLAFRLSAGQDPALGSPSAAVATQQPRPAVIHRRIVNTKVVSLPPKAGTSTTSVASAAAGSSATVGTAPAGPVAAPAPAPAPAPTAPVTSTS
jgi:hypothetical protein